MFCFKISDNIPVAPIETVTLYERITYDLKSVSMMAPGIITQVRMKPEMEIVFIKGAFYNPVKSLPHNKPRDLFSILRIYGLYYM